MPVQNEVSLRIQIDDQGTKTLVNVIKLLEQLQDSVRKSASSFKSIERSTNTLNNSLGRTTSSTRQFEDRLNRLQREMESTRRTTDRAEGSMLDYSEALSRVAFGLSRVRDFGARQITGFINAASRLENVTQAYTSVLGSANKANEAISRLRQASQDPGLTFEVAARATQRFLAFGVSLEDAVQITRNFANAAVVSGTSTAELDTGLQQLAKSIGTGKIEQDDLNSITERFGPIAQNIRSEYGKTGAEVTKAFTMAGESVAQFALNVSDLDKQPKAASDSLTNAISNLENAWNEFSTEIGNVFLPIAKDVIGTLTDILKYFNDLPQPVKTAAAVTAGLTTAIAALGTAAVAAAAGVTALGVAVGVAGGGAVAGGGLTAAAVAGTAAIKGFVAAVAPIAVPVALAAGSVVALATAIHQFKQYFGSPSSSTRRTW